MLRKVNTEHDNKPADSKNNLHINTITDVSYSERCAPTTNEDESRTRTTYRNNLQQSYDTTNRSILMNPNDVFNNSAYSTYHPASPYMPYTLYPIPYAISYAAMKSQSTSMTSSRSRMHAYCKERSPSNSSLQSGYNMIPHVYKYTTYLQHQQLIQQHYY